MPRARRLDPASGHSAGRRGAHQRGPSPAGPAARHQHRRHLGDLASRRPAARPALAGQRGAVGRGGRHGRVARPRERAQAGRRGDRQRGLGPGALSDDARRLLVACGAGAGLAAAYGVPLGGALFALEVLRGELALRFVLPALLTSLIADGRGLAVPARRADLRDPRPMPARSGVPCGCCWPVRWPASSPCSMSARWRGPTATGRKVGPESRRRCSRSGCWAPCRSPSRSSWATVATWRSSPSPAR